MLLSFAQRHPNFIESRESTRSCLESLILLQRVTPAGNVHNAAILRNIEITPHLRLLP